MRLRQLNILIAEDDDDHAELIEFNLKETGVVKSLQRARDGEEAFSKIKYALEAQEKGLINLVLLDLKLPKLNGLEVLASVKKLENAGLIPIVMLSTSASSKDRTAAYMAQVNSYLVKPMDFDEFGQMIKDFATYWGRWNHLL